MGGIPTQEGTGLIHTRPSKRVPKRGPFRALSEIVRRRIELDGVDDWIDRRLNDAFPSVSLPNDHPFAPYEGGEHNDARVLGCHLDGSDFTLTIDHYNVERLAAVLLKDGEWRRRGLGWFKGRFPVTLRFEGIREIHVLEDAEVGRFRKVRASLRGLSNALDDVILLRCIGYDENTLRFHLEFNTQYRIEIQKSWGILPTANMFIECATVSVKEDLRQKWIETVDEGTLPLLEALLAEGPVQSWCVPDFEAFVQNMGRGP